MLIACVDLEIRDIEKRRRELTPDILRVEDIEYVEKALGIIERDERRLYQLIQETERQLYQALVLERLFAADVRDLTGTRTAAFSCQIRFGCERTQGG